MGFLDSLQVTGEYSSYNVMVRLKKEAVQSMLPEGLELAQQPITPAEEHPVFLFFGHQQHVRLQWGQLKGPGFSYREFAVGVPYIQSKKTSAGPFFFMPRLYLNKILPILVGYFWGLAKDKAQITEESHDYEVTDLQNNLLVSCQFRLKGHAGKPADFSSLWPLLQPLHQPVIGKTILGPFVCFAMNAHLDQAQIQMVEADVRIARPFLPGLPVGNLPETDKAILGAYYMDNHWTMHLPMTCSQK